MTEINIVHTIIVSVVTALATIYALVLALALERWTWSKSLHYPNSYRPRQPKKFAEPLIRGTVLIAGAYTLYYLIWRLSTLNPEAMWLSWLLWLAEAYGFITFLLFALMTWRLVYPKTPEPKPGIAIDVFVPTRGEPLDILRATLVGCNCIRYPHQTFVLDDSGRPEVKTLATSLGCHCISRPTHEGAKAGNLNYALKQTKGELIAVLDADHIPLPEFLNDTIGFFDDPSVAVVQGPQLFYNLDSFQHESSAWHEQRIFFHVIMPGKNRTNSAFWCGSPAVLRRSSIEAIGGIAQETVTEDLHTTLKLVKKGYHVLYTHRPLAAGLSPATISEYLKQRFRWGQGAMQVLRSKESPIWTRGLRLGQRLSFITSTITYFDGLQLLILLAIPLVTLFSGLPPVSTFGWAFTARLLPYLFLTFFTNLLLGRGTYNALYTECYGLIRTFTFLSVLPTLLTGRARPFQVTTKEAGKTTGTTYLRLVIPHFIFIGLYLIAIGFGGFNLSQQIGDETKSVTLGVVILWAQANVILLGIGASRLLSMSQRLRYRFPLVTEVFWRRAGDSDLHSGYSLNLSATGISFEHKGPRLHVGDLVEMTVIATISDSKLAARDSAPGALALARDPALCTPSEYKIPFTGRVTSSYVSHLDSIQRLGIVIENFASEADANNYTYLIHHPSHLLQGEDVFRPPESLISTPGR